MIFDTKEHSHRRYNPLSDKWILVSPHRAKRPWQGQTEVLEDPPRINYDPHCYLCAGNQRINGEMNPNYKGPFVFQNDFSALLGDSPEYIQDENPLFRCESVKGVSRVICYSPDHSKTLPLLTESEIHAVIKSWIEQSHVLGKEYVWVQLFENKGSMMGCSNPHPHGQIWAGNFIPQEIVVENQQQQTYYQQYGCSLLMDYIAKEQVDGQRIVEENDYWIVVVPYWATWPYETLLLPKHPTSRMVDLNLEQQLSLSVILKKLTIRYDNLFQCSFPYSMGWHGAPNNLLTTTHWQLHAHFYPPLLRSATVRKFLVGYEMLAENQRDLTAEQAAEILKKQSTQHYLELKERE